MRSSIRTATRGMRIMSADVVPGVAKSARNGGGQVTQKLTPTAAAGADRLKQMVAQQAAAKKNAVIEAQLAHEEQEALDALVGKTLDRRATIADLRGALDGCIDGQKLGKDVVARALRRRRMLLDDGERPLRLLFAGPSGVGKTAMATALCEAVFGAAVPDRNFKRFNLSEYSHPSKFNRLTGGDPNYVGYKEGGELSNFIRQAEERRAGRKSAVSHTSCVVLLDEVDRAADGLLTFLMNFLDQGQLTDGRGDTVDARRAIIVMTTNVGTDTDEPSRRSRAPTTRCSTRRRAMRTMRRTLGAASRCRTRWSSASAATCSSTCATGGGRTSGASATSSPSCRSTAPAAAR